MGGVDYHLKNDQILEELAEYKAIFEKTLTQDSEIFKSLKKENLEIVRNASDEERIGFMRLFFS